MHVLTHWELPEVSHPGLTDHLVFSLHVWGCLSHRMFRCPRIKENGKLKVLVSHCVVSLYRRLMLLNKLEKKSSWKPLNTRAFSLRRQAFFKNMRRKQNSVPSFCLPRERLFACFLALLLSRFLVLPTWKMERSPSRNATESVAFGDRDRGQNWSTHGREYWACLNPGSVVSSCIFHFVKSTVTKYSPPFDCHLLYLFSLAGRQTRKRKVWLKESDQEKTEPVC